MIIVGAFYIPLLAFIYIYLSANVIKNRRKHKIALGTDNPEVLRASRAHGNFAEFVPIALILLIIAELNGTGSILLNLLYIVLIFGRIVHAYSILNPNEQIKYRATGVMATFIVIVVSGFIVLLG